MELEEGEGDGMMMGMCRLKVMAVIAVVFRIVCFSVLVFCFLCACFFVSLCVFLWPASIIRYPLFLFLVFVFLSTYLSFYLFTGCPWFYVFLLLWFYAVMSYV